MRNRRSGFFRFLCILSLVCAAVSLSACGGGTGAALVESPVPMFDAEETQPTSPASTEAAGEVTPSPNSPSPAPETAEGATDTAIPSDPQNLEEAMAQAILDKNKGQLEPHEHLTQAHTVIAQEWDGDRVTVYAMALFEAFTAHDGLLETSYGGHFPIAVTFDTSEGGYTVVDYWEPRDGAHYSDSIDEKFPDGITFDDIDTQKHIQTHIQSCYAQAIEFMNIDAYARVDALLDAVCASKSEVKKIFDQREMWGATNSNSTEFRELLYYGRYTLVRCADHFKRDDISDTQSRVMAAACYDIMVIMGEEPPEPLTEDGRAWFDAVLTRTVSLRSEAGAANMAERYPASWTLLMAWEGQPS